MKSFTSAGPVSSWTQNAAWTPCLCLDRKSTRLNSSHANISYAVFCLKKTPIHRGAGGVPLRQLEVVRERLPEVVQSTTPAAGPPSAPVPYFEAAADGLVLHSPVRVAP